MPASIIDSYLQDARNNFDAVRPTPVYTDVNQSMGQCQNVHVSTNCYYGYHDLKNSGNNHVDTDCEMVELRAVQDNRTSSKIVSKKRCADEQDYPQTKRLRDDVETATKLGMEASCLELEAQCDEIRLYFRGYGAIDFQLQPMFTTPNSQQSRHISLSHGPYDLISTEMSKLTKKLIQKCPFYLQKYKERKTLNLRQMRQ